MALPRAGPKEIHVQRTDNPPNGLAGEGRASINAADRVALVSMFAVAILIAVTFAATQPAAKWKPAEAVMTPSHAGSLLADTCRAIRTTHTTGG